MQATFLTAQESDNYNHISKLEEDELLRGFYLTKADKIFVNGFNGVANRFCISIQLCLIRYFGFLEDDWKTLIVENIGEFIASQLGMTEFEKKLLNDYGQRAMSRSFHIQQILKYLQYRRWEPILDEPTIENGSLNEVWNMTMNGGYWINFVKNYTTIKFFDLPSGHWKGLLGV